MARNSSAKKSAARGKIGPLRRNLSVCIVGPGRLGSALAFALHQAGFQVRELVARNATNARAIAKKIGAKSVHFDDATLDADVVWLTVSDSAIRGTAALLAAKRPEWSDTAVFHSSGALSSEELAPLRDRGAAVASVHPLMTFSGRRKAGSLFPGIFVAVEGDTRAIQTAEHVVGRLGAVPMAIDPAHKAAYHAWASFGSPLLIALLAVTEKIGTIAGLDHTMSRRAIMPLVVKTLENYASQGAADAFTGPLVRGDVGTVRKHLSILDQAPAARAAYVALAKAALETLPVGNSEEIRKLLV